MFCGVATLLLMVIVVVLTASAGGVVGLLGDAADDDELEFELQAPMAHAPAIAITRQRLRRFTIFILPLDSTRAATSHPLAFHLCVAQAFTPAARQTSLKICAT